MKKYSYSVVMPVLIRHNWQYHMTICAINTLLATTKMVVEVVLVEAIPKFSRGSFTADAGDWGVDQCVQVEYSGNATHDINLGIEIATGDRVIYMGNDLFMRPEWLEALHECFIDKGETCGIATLASHDLRDAGPGQFFGQQLISEGIYGPLMAFDRSWRFDEEVFPNQFADADLIMKVYLQGQRAYRNNRVIIEHLNGQTINGPDHAKGFAEAKERFIQIYGRTGLLMYRALAEGWII